MNTLIENKEKYFIQPFIEGLKCIIKCEKNSKNAVNIKAYDENNKRINLTSHINKQLKDSYKNSLYFGNNIILKAFLVNNEENKTSLLIYDILLDCEFNNIKQSKRYSIRYENLIFRFLTNKTKNINVVFSHQINDINLNMFIDKFIVTNRLKSIVFRKNVPYNFEDNDVIIANVVEHHDGKVIGYSEGTIIQRTFNEESGEVETEMEIPCIDSFDILDHKSNEIINISIKNLNDSIKRDYYININDLINKECVYGSYKILDKFGNMFVDFKK